MTELLRVTGLDVRLPTVGGAEVQLLHDVELEVAAGEAVALVGPSGAGKSLLARALCGLLPTGAVAGTVTWRDRSFAAADQAAWSMVRGAGITLVMQDPGAGLNPVRRVGDQIAETVCRHRGCSAGEAHDHVVALLAETQVPDAEACARAWPHELSGGQQQRALLAAALACEPGLLIADEPTTALDPTVQASILYLLDDLRARRDMALLLISHDRDLVSLLTGRTINLRDGRVVEGPTTAAVLPPVVGAGRQEDDDSVLTARDITVTWPGASRPALRGVDVNLDAGLVVGLAGESGCGKTTLARVLAGHMRPDSGRVELGGRDLHALRGAEFRRMRRQVQLLFQHAGAALDPRQRGAAALAEAGASGEKAAALLREMDLDPDVLDRLPHQLSGGQRQRLALARALAPGPRVLLADEPTNALDAEATARVRSLLLETVRRHRLAMVLISHDLPLLLRTADRILVMLDGVIIEDFAVDGRPPLHPYTRTLVSAATPQLVRARDQWRAVAAGMVPRHGEKGNACPFNAVCPIAKPGCTRALPGLESVSQNHRIRCPEVGRPVPPLFIDT